MCREKTHGVVSLFGRFCFVLLVTDIDAVRSGNVSNNNRQIGSTRRAIWLSKYRNIGLKSKIERRRLLNWQTSSRKHGHGPNSGNNDWDPARRPRSATRKTSKNEARRKQDDKRWIIEQNESRPLTDHGQRIRRLVTLSSWLWLLFQGPCTFPRECSSLEVRE